MSSTTVMPGNQISTLKLNCGLLLIKKASLSNMSRNTTIPTALQLWFNGLVNLMMVMITSKVIFMTTFRTDCTPVSQNWPSLLLFVSWFITLVTCTSPSTMKLNTVMPTLRETQEPIRLPWNIITVLMSYMLSGTSSCTASITILLDQSKRKSGSFFLQTQ